MKNYKQFINENLVKNNNNMEVKYHCHECGWEGWLPMTKIVKCPKCGNKNDIWEEGQPVPKRHKKMNKK